jgi:predicted GNAT family N-acyltransferase
MALKMIDHGSKEYQQMVNLRYNILRKPLGLNFTQEELDKEKQNVLIGAFEDDQLLGCCMLVKEENRKMMRLRQVAVPNNQQGKGIGRALMAFAENISRDLGYSRIMMHARKTAIPFFEKLGYKVTSEPFDEITIQHHIMEKEL